MREEGHYTAVEIAPGRAFYLEGSTPTFAAATPLRVEFLIAYMASSARCSNSTLDLASVGYDATPMLAVKWTFSPSVHSQFVSPINLCSRRATTKAFSLEACGSTITNSSPPYRNAKSILRQVFLTI